MVPAPWLDPAFGSVTLAPRLGPIWSNTYHVTTTLYTDEGIPHLGNGPDIHQWLRTASPAETVVALRHADTLLLEYGVHHVLAAVRGDADTEATLPFDFRSWRKESVSSHHSIPRGCPVERLTLDIPSMPFSSLWASSLGRRRIDLLDDTAALSPGVLLAVLTGTPFSDWLVLLDRVHDRLKTVITDRASFDLNEQSAPLREAVLFLITLMLSEHRRVDHLFTVSEVPQIVEYYLHLPSTSPLQHSVERRWLQILADVRLPVSPEHESHTFSGDLPGWVRLFGNIAFHPLPAMEEDMLPVFWERILSSRSSSRLTQLTLLEKSASEISSLLRRRPELVPPDVVQWALSLMGDAPSEMTRPSQQRHELLGALLTHGQLTEHTRIEAERAIAHWTLSCCTLSPRLQDQLELHSKIIPRTAEILAASLNDTPAHESYHRILSLLRASVDERGPWHTAATELSPLSLAENTPVPDASLVPLMIDDSQIHFWSSVFAALSPQVVALCDRQLLARFLQSPERAVRLALIRRFSHPPLLTADSSPLSIDDQGEER